MSALDDCTISINGGPHLPATAVRGVLRDMKRGKRTTAQTDIEDDALGGRDPDNEARVAGIAADRLRSLIERIERLEEQRKELGDDIKDIYAETKSAGFDVAVVRQLVRIRKQDAAQVEEQESLLDLYRRALGDR